MVKELAQGYPASEQLRRPKHQVLPTPSPAHLPLGHTQRLSVLVTSMQGLLGLISYLPGLDIGAKEVRRK